MNWGLICRSERDRGLGIQTKAMYDNLHPDKTLVVVNKRSGFESHPEDYPGATVADFRNEHGRWKFADETIVRDWLSGLDVVVSVETLYDWDLFGDVTTIVHGNPEFWMASNTQPDVWWWPTTWRTDVLPPGPIVPVPVPDVPIIAGNPYDSRQLSITHVVGSGAMEDRNGSSVVRHAQRRLEPGIKFHIYSQQDNPVENRWDMYRGHDILVLPRRYGGLCLPALEAMASGLMVIMPNTSPNGDWPVRLIECEPGKIVNMQTGPVELCDMMPNWLINELRHLETNRSKVDEWQQRSREWAEQNQWLTLKERYFDEIHRASLL